MITFVLFAATFILACAMVRISLDHFSCQWYRRRAGLVEEIYGLTDRDQWCEKFHDAMDQPKPLYVQFNDVLENWHV